MPEGIAILGAGGFLGSHLTEALLAESNRPVVALDLSLAKISPRARANGRLCALEGSVADAKLLAFALEHCSVVLSLTALCNPALYNTQPLAVIDGSFTHLLPLVAACTAQRRWLIHFSTCEVYGTGERDPQSGAFMPMSEDESPLILGPVHKERWSYACAKQLLERVIWAQGQHQQLPFTIIRPFNVIGPRMDYLDGIDGQGTPRVLACFMKALLEQSPLKLVDGGTQRRTFLSVADFVDVILRVLERKTSCVGQIINVGSTQNDISIGELGAKMRAIYAERHGGARDLPLESVSATQFYGAGYDDVDARIPDLTKLTTLLGPLVPTRIDDMLPPIIDDYVARYSAVRSPKARPGVPLARAAAR